MVWVEGTLPTKFSFRPCSSKFPNSSATIRISGEVKSALLGTFRTKYFFPFSKISPSASSGAALEESAAEGELGASEAARGFSPPSPQPPKARVRNKTAAKGGRAFRISDLARINISL
jgi:hypothetical protein